MSGKSGRKGFSAAGSLFSDRLLASLSKEGRVIRALVIPESLDVIGNQICRPLFILIIKTLQQHRYSGYRDVFVACHPWHLDLGNPYRDDEFGLS